MRCVSGKVCYHSEGEAEEALIYLQAKYNNGGNGPVAVYQCDYCSYFHTTSKGSPNELLTSKQTQDRIKLQQEANYWEDKFK